MLKSGFSSQSGARSFDRFDAFWEGLGEAPGEFDVGEEPFEDVDDDAGQPDSGHFCLEELPKLVEAKRR